MQALFSSSLCDRNTVLLNGLSFSVDSNFINRSLRSVSLFKHDVKKSNSESYLKIDEAILKQLKRAQRKISEQLGFITDERVSTLSHR